MITLAGSSHLSFQFPAELPIAFDYFGHIRRTLALLPHIQLQAEYGPMQYRMQYATLELGLYQVRLVCDIQVKLDEAEKLLCIEPFEGWPPVKAAATLNTLTAPGYYRSRSHFTPLEAGLTQIDYQLKLDAALPTPLLARIMPTPVLNSIAHNIANGRIHEIAQGYIQRSIEDYASSAADKI